MIIATGVELRAGSRLLVEGASFRVNPGDKIGLVGRNGAGKTTLMKVLAGEGVPAAGTVTGGRHGKAQIWIRRSTAETISATASSMGTPFFCSPLR